MYMIIDLVSVGVWIQTGSVSQTPQSVFSHKTTLFNHHDPQIETSVHVIPVCPGNRVVKKDLFPITEQVSRSPGDHLPFFISCSLRGPNHTAHMLHYKSDILMAGV